MPWNPARLEQRIGRVDRIGQSRPVHLTLLVARHATESGLIAHLAKRVMAARRPLGDAALVDVPPSEAQVRLAVFDRAPISPPLAPPVPAIELCRRWSRPARRIAGVLARRRALGDRWRSPEPQGRPVTSDLARAPGVAAVCGRGLVLVFSVPLVDRTGATIERHVVAVRVTRGACHAGSAPQAALVEVAAAAAVQSLSARLRRARRLRAATVDRAVAVEHALADESRAAIDRREAQPGLFDGRERRAFEDAQAAVAAIDCHLGSALERLRLSADLDTGRPVLEIVLSGSS